MRFPKSKYWRIIFWRKIVILGQFYMTLVIMKLLNSIIIIHALQIPSIINVEKVRN